MDDGALIVVERSGEGSNFALDRPLETGVAVEDEHAALVVAAARRADGGRGDGHGRRRFGGSLGGRFGHRRGDAEGEGGGSGLAAGSGLGDDLEGIDPAGLKCGRADVEGIAVHAAGMDDGALIVVERSGEGGDFALDRPVEGRITVEDEHAAVVIAIRRRADGRRGDGHGRGRFGRRLRGRLGGRLGAVDILFQIVLRAGGEHAVGREYLVAVVGVDLTLEVDDGLRGGRSVHAVGIVEQAEDDQLLLHEADGLRVGVGVHEYIVVLVAGLLGGLLCRLLGGLLRRLLRGLLGHGVVHVVFQ